MSVFRDLEIGYGGENYVLTPSNRMLRRIEAGLAPSSLTDVIARTASGKPPISEISYILAEFLKEAGAEGVDEDEMYGELMSDLLNNEGKVFASLTEVVVQAISPTDSAGKKLKPQSQKKAASKK